MSKIFETLFPGIAAARQRSIVELERSRAMLKLFESVPEWAQDGDENEWRELGKGRENYSEADLRTLREQSRKLYYTNPSARGVIETMVMFIVGRHATMVPEAEGEKPLQYWTDWADENGWDKRAKEAVRRLFRDGEVFVRFFETDGGIVIRFVEPSEITDETSDHSYGIETDPDDVEKVIKYHRSYMKGNVKATEVIPAEEIVHWKILCDSNEKRGVSFLIGIAKYIKQYGRWLDDRVRLNRLRSIYNLIIKPDGITPANFKSQAWNDETTTPVGSTPSSKIPKPGTAIIAQGVDYEFKTLDLKANDTQHDGRAIERMICKGTSLVEGIVTGDYSNQNYASSLVAESPMVKAIEGWQDEVEGLFQAIFKKVFEGAIKANKLPGDTSIKSAANFATMVHRELDKDTAAYAMHSEKRWASNKTISVKLGYDYEDEQEQIDKEDKDEEERMKKMTGYEMPGVIPQGKEQNQNGKDKEKFIPGASTGGNPSRGKSNGATS